jgi:pimeloyl-ACP methyl ester carboxylesterase
MKRIVATALAAGLTISGMVVAAGSATAGQTGFMPTPPSWGHCANTTLQQKGAECGMLEVPLDYAQPQGTKIKIAVSRITHKVPEDKYQGVVLTNPGGPGEPGLTNASIGGRVPNGVGDEYDWVGFDPRGVGTSQPALACDGRYFGYDRPDYRPFDPRDEQAWLKKTKAYADTCATNSPELLKHVKTTDTVEDMESIRKALGRQDITYYGGSYGTYLGQVYSTLHPDRVRRMVLDSNVDPRRVWYSSNFDQDVAFEGNVKIFFDWVANYDRVYHLGTNGTAIERGFNTQVDKVKAHPALGVLGPDELVDVFTGVGSSVFGWTDVASAYAAWIRDNNATPLKALYDGGIPPDNFYAMNLATLCTDAQSPNDWTKWRADSWQTYRKAPLLTWSNTWLNAPCASWGAKAGTPVQIDGRKVGSALLIGETLDAPTPFSGALEVRRRYPNSSLIEGVGGTTHKASLHGIPCVDGAVADYLATGKLPHRLPGNQSDLKCAPIPQPVPTTS